MQKTRMMRLAGVSAVVLSAGLWALVPAWGQSSPAKGMAGMGGTGNVALTKDIAAARVATAKYATNLAAAQADGYQILTKEVPGMGFHFVNPNISGFDVTKPPILVYYTPATGGSLCPEWVFTSIPKTPRRRTPRSASSRRPVTTWTARSSRSRAGGLPDDRAGYRAAFFFWHPSCTRCTSGPGTGTRLACTPA